MNLKLLMNHVNLGDINIQKHPTEELYIYNYSKTCQFERNWNEVTLNCRGLILDELGNVVARPFPKFFNWEEHLQEDLPEIPSSESFKVYDKMDGSLGIMYFIKDIPYIATRGSFNSEQAIVATQILREKYNDVKWDKSITHLFEIIYPSNRIVVDYGAKEDLILLGGVNIDTGKELLLDDPYYSTLGVPMVKEHPELVNFQSIKDLELENSEGFVIRFESGFRMKIKFEEYCRLHKLLTQVSTTSIWEILSSGGDMKEIIENVPDEYFDWVRNVVDKLKSDYKEIEKNGKSLIENNQELLPFAARYKFTRFLWKLYSNFMIKFGKNWKDPRDFKEFSLSIQDEDQSLKTVAFSIIRGRDYSKSVWKNIKPKWEKAFNTKKDE